jgi:hypothetical protein
MVSAQSAPRRGSQRKRDEGRDPSAMFSTNGYLTGYPDVAAAGVNPLEHYLQFGMAEGRNPQG